MANAKVMEVLEKAVDAVEETAETVERIPKANLNGTTKRQQIIILTVTAAASAAVSSAVTWFIANKRLKFKYEAILEKEIEETRKYYKVVRKAEEFSDPVKVLQSKTEELGYTGRDSTLHAVNDPEVQVKVEQAIDAVEEATDEVVAIFSGDVREFDWSEADARSEVFPYVITVQEFFQGDQGYTQQALTYYGGDRQMVDEQDKPFEEVDNVVGNDNLAKFGYGSDDANVVYVRNERLETDFEVHYAEGKYSDLQTGFLEHSDTSSTMSRREIREHHRRSGRARHRGGDG